MPSHLGRACRPAARRRGRGRRALARRERRKSDEHEARRSPESGSRSLARHDGSRALGEAGWQTFGSWLGSPGVEARRPGLLRGHSRVLRGRRLRRGHAVGVGMGDDPRPGRNAPLRRRERARDLGRQCALGAAPRRRRRDGLVDARDVAPPHRLLGPRPHPRVRDRDVPGAAALRLRPRCARTEARGRARRPDLAGPAVLRERRSARCVSA